MEVSCSPNPNPFHASFPDIHNWVLKGTPHATVSGLENDSQFFCQTVNLSPLLRYFLRARLMKDNECILSNTL